MGFKFSEDGECKVCGMHTTKFCDGCGKYICDEHTIEMQIEKSSEHAVLCRECYEGGAKLKNAHRLGRHPHYG